MFLPSPDSCELSELIQRLHATGFRNLVFFLKHRIASCIYSCMERNLTVVTLSDRSINMFLNVRTVKFGSMEL